MEFLVKAFSDVTHSKNENHAVSTIISDKIHIRQLILKMATKQKGGDMAYKFDKQGFMIIPDPLAQKAKKEIAQALEEKLVKVTQAFCPHGHNLITNTSSFTGHNGLEIRYERANGEGGTLFVSPILGDKTVVFVGSRPNNGERIKFLCPHCGIEIPVLSKCDKCHEGEMRILSLDPKFDQTNGIAICDLVGCPSAYVLDAGQYISLAYLGELL